MRGKRQLDFVKEMIDASEFLTKLKDEMFDEFGKKISQKQFDTENLRKTISESSFDYDTERKVQKTIWHVQREYALAMAVFKIYNAVKENGEKLERDDKVGLNSRDLENNLISIKRTAASFGIHTDLLDLMGTPEEFHEMAKEYYAYKTEEELKIIVEPDKETKAFFDANKEARKKECLKMFQPDMIETLPEIEIENKQSSFLYLLQKSDPTFFQNQKGEACYEMDKMKKYNPYRTEFIPIEDSQIVKSRLNTAPETYEFNDLGELVESSYPDGFFNKIGFFFRRLFAQKDAKALREAIDNEKAQSKQAWEDKEKSVMISKKKYNDYVVQFNRFEYLFPEKYEMKSSEKREKEDEKNKEPENDRELIEKLEKSKNEELGGLQTEEAVKQNVKATDLQKKESVSEKEVLSGNP